MQGSRPWRPTESQSSRNPRRRRATLSVTGDQPEEQPPTGDPHAPEAPRDGRQEEFLPEYAGTPDPEEREDFLPEEETPEDQPEEYLPEELNPDRATSETVADEAALAHAASELDAVEAALVRLDEGTFDTCEVCGAPIGQHRLLRDPLLTRCEAHTRPQQ